MTKSLTDWTRVDAMRDEEIDFSDGSEVTAEMLAKTGTITQTRWLSEFLNLGVSDSPKKENLLKILNQR